MDFLALWKARIDAASVLCGSQNKLADALGMRPSRMSAIRNGKEAIPLAKLAIIAELTKTDLSELQGIQGAVRAQIGSPYASVKRITRQGVLR